MHTKIQEIAHCVTVMKKVKENSPEQQRTPCSHATILKLNFYETRARILEWSASIHGKTHTAGTQKSR